MKEFWRTFFNDLTKLKGGEIVEFIWEGRKEKGTIMHWYISSSDNGNQIFRLSIKPFNENVKVEKDNSWKSSIFERFGRIVIEKQTNEIKKWVRILE